MPFDFDAVIPRAGTDCVKYDLRKTLFGREDVIPMWVADMDFAVPPFVAEAVRKRAGHPVYGYSVIPESYYDAVISWEKRRHGWELRKEWILFSPGVVTGLNMIVQAFTEPGDKIIIQPPVYHPFFFCVENNGRQLVLNRLKEENGHYSMDFDDLERKMKEGARMMILCSPHNPVSRCWRREELEWLGAKCKENRVLLVSDEIHGDLVYSPNKHVPLASISDDFAANTITCIAPSKTFNLAGLFTSSVIIPNENLRKQFIRTQEKLHISPNLFGITAAEAAYREGAEWLDQLLGYLKSNADQVKDFLAGQIPVISLSPVEATYLLWLDFRKLGLPDAELKKLLVEKAGLGFFEGITFGPGGEGFQRMNIGCPSKILKEALQRLASAIND